MWQGMRCLDTVAGSRTAEVTATCRVAMWQGMVYSLPEAPRSVADDPVQAHQPLHAPVVDDPASSVQLGVMRGEP
jgi:hypothetical protein